MYLHPQKNQNSRLNPAEIWTMLHGWVWLQIGAALVLWKSLVAVGVWLGQRFLPQQPAFSRYHEFGGVREVLLPVLWRTMSNFDAQHYLSIAQQGYLANTQAFFPLYPLAISLAAHWLHLPFIIAALLISHGSVALALFFCWKLLRIDVVGSSRQRSFFVFLVIVLFFPTAMFYGAIYNDSLFFLLATVTLWLGRRRQWWWAGVFGALATLTRLNGLALWPFMVVELLSAHEVDEQLWWRPSRWKHGVRQIVGTLFTPAAWRGVIASALIPAAFFGYLAYQQVVSGSWQVVFRTMEIWHQSTVTFPPQVVWRYVKILATTPFTQFTYWVAALELGSVLFYVGALAYAWRKISFSYWIFLAVSILIPWLTGSFQGMPRYGLHLYPLFLVIWLAIHRLPRAVQWIVLMVSVVLFVGYTMFFTRGYFVA